MSHPGAEALVGVDVAGYAVRELLGRGGMGVVYLADHPRLERLVALKVLAPELADNKSFRERFLRESRIAAGLNHPHVVPIHDAGEADGRLYITMHYVEASDLRALLRQSGALAPGRAVALLGQVASALDAAHRSGLVHRDVKPGNVLIAQDDHAYLTDFGVTKQLESESDEAVAGELLGTLAYVAPEQIEGGAIDGLVDVYSLACVLYECLTGRPPFERESDLSLLWAHVQEDPPAVTDARPELPSGLDAVVARGMAKRPEERYATCGALIAAAAEAVSKTASDRLPAALEALGPPLVGRAAELAWLRSRWARARSGEGSVVLVSGPRGSGKTRLAAELAREAHSGGAAVRYVTAIGADGAGAAVPSSAPERSPLLVVVDDLDAARRSSSSSSGSWRTRGRTGRCSSSAAHVARTRARRWRISSDGSSRTTLTASWAGSRSRPSRRSWRSTPAPTGRAFRSTRPWPRPTACRSACTRSRANGRAAR